VFVSVVELCNVREGWQPLSTPLGINTLLLLLIVMKNFYAAVG